MKWVAISGSWRATNAQVEKDVRHEVRDILARGDGIVTGGALGVDYIATDEALKHDPSAARIKVILPTPLDVYAAHYLKRAEEGVISKKQAQENNVLLARVQQVCAASLVELGFNVCMQETYYARDQAVIDAADSLVAFQVNASAGTQDTIDRARAKGLDVKQLKYTIKPASPRQSPRAPRP